jgi:hypothetical protein
VQIPVLVLDDCIFNYLFFALTGFHPSTGRPDLSTLSDKAASSPGTISLATFHALESLMNQTTEGQRLTALYRTHSPELLTMALANQQLAQAEANLVLSFQPLVTALLLGKGNQPIVSQQMIDQVNAVWDQIASLASSDLKAAMETERTRLNRFQSIVSKPFSEWAGLLNVRSPVAPWIYISSPRRVGAAFNLQANGSALAGTLFRSPNALSDWHPVTGATRTVTGDSIEFTDPAAPLGAVFYQIRVVTQ